jgi:hypothetical protein
MRRLLTATALFAVLAAPLASAQTISSGPPANPTVLMSPVALPIVVDGRLVNYVYVTLRLVLAPDADAPRMRSKEPYFRDALVRAAHRQPFVRNDSYVLVDDARLKAAILHDAATIAGPGMVVSIQILREQPQHYDGLPRPKAAQQQH